MISQYFLNDYLSFGIVFAFALGKEIKDQIVYKGFDSNITARNYSTFF